MHEFMNMTRYKHRFSQTTRVQQRCTKTQVAAGERQACRRGATSSASGSTPYLRMKGGGLGTENAKRAEIVLLEEGLQVVGEKVVAQLVGEAHKVGHQLAAAVRLQGGQRRGQLPRGGFTRSPVKHVRNSQTAATASAAPPPRGRTFGRRTWAPGSAGSRWAPRSPAPPQKVGISVTAPCTTRTTWSYRWITTVLALESTSAACR